MFHRFQIGFVAWMVASIAFPMDTAHAQESLIKTLDGKISISVEIIKFDDKTIFAKSSLGEHTFARSEVECIGKGCPPAISDEPAVVQTPEATAPKAANPNCVGEGCEVAAGSVGINRDVTLTMKVGGVEIAGELIEETGREYVLLTPTGEFRIAKDIVTCAGPACTGEALPNASTALTSKRDEGQSASPESPAEYPIVTLVTNVGGVEIQGELKEFTGTEYVLQTITGEYRFKVDIVTCTGASCPRNNAEVAIATPTVRETITPETVQSVVAETQAEEPEQTTSQGSNSADADIRFSSSYSSGRDLLRSLWRGYANSLALDHELSGASDVGYFRNASGALKETHAVDRGEAEQPFSPLINNTAHFVLASRPPNALEAEALARVGVRDLMSDENHTVVSTAGIVIIVHPNNPVNALRLDEVLGIYNGSITNWSQIGGLNAPIQTVAQDSKTAIRQTFDRVVSGGSGFDLDPGVEVSAGGDDDVRDMVLSDQYAIGYVILNGAERAKHLSIANTCGFEYAAIPFSIKAQEYPLTQSQYLFFNNRDAGPKAKQFFEYAGSLSVNEATAAPDAAPSGIERQPEAFAAGHRKALWRGSSVAAGERDAARRLLYDLRDWDRLSTTIRFRIGSTKLGAQELFNIRQLVEYVSSQSDVTELAVVGFTDDIGSFSANMRLSTNRAKLVEEAISAEAAGKLQGTKIFTKAYGELAPVACNSDVLGRQMNRRVEIWINDARQ